MGVIADNYNASFDSVGFLELAEGSGFTSAPQPERSTVYPLPSADDYVEISMGLGPREWSITVGVESVNLTSLIGKVGTSASLVWHRGTWTSVRLLEVGIPNKTPGYDAFKVPLKFRRKP